MGPIRRPRVFNGPLVKPRAPGRFGDLARMMALGMLLVLPFFLSASLRAKLHQYRTEVVDLEAHIKQLDEQRQRRQRPVELERAVEGEPAVAAPEDPREDLGRAHLRVDDAAGPLRLRGGLDRGPVEGGGGGRC